MSLHHLDPRQAGTGAAPDVETRQHSVGALNGDRWMALAEGSGRVHTFYPTESSALAAARQAAGFGHVAERACGLPFVPALCGMTRQTYSNDCVTCGWSYAAHPTARPRAAEPCTSYLCYCDRPSPHHVDIACLTCAWPRSAHQ